jgi:hypothetical protein
MKHRRDNLERYLMRTPEQRKSMGRRVLPLAKNVNPLVKELFNHVDNHPWLTRDHLSIESGYSYRGIAEIARGTYTPRLQTFQDMLNAVGLELKIVKKESK